MKLISILSHLTTEKVRIQRLLLMLCGKFLIFPIFFAHFFPNPVKLVDLITKMNNERIRALI